MQKILNTNKKKKSVILLISDIAIIMLAYYICLLLHQDEITVNILATTMPIAIIDYVLFLKLFKMYNCIWINAVIY